MPSSHLLPQTKPIEGIRENTPQVHALTNANIVQAPGRALDKGTLVLRDGVIIAVGAEVAIPADARIWDYSGLTVYPGLIEPYSHLGLPKEKSSERPAPANEPAQDQKTGVEHWNERVRPNLNVAEVYQPGEEDLKKLRSLGFTAALIVPDKGILCGASALVHLGDGDLSQQILRANVAQHLALTRASIRNRSRSYPNSLMGAIALIRQTLLDAQWYEQANDAYQLKSVGQKKPETNEALAALAPVIQRNQPVVFEIDNDLNFLRAENVAKEFGLNFMVRGCGEEYRVLEQIKASGAAIILPVNFPETPKVETPEDALAVTLEELGHWEAAPSNPKWLQETGITFALTTDDLKNPSDFPGRVR
ncbi:MAG TPA: hypothetical protein VGA99_10845, partial [bacterium]